MGFKKGNQNIDSVFYGTDYVERMYLGGGEPFFQASYLDFYKTNFFSIGLGQEKRQIDNPKGDGAISYIKTEWSSQYGYQLEVKQDKAGRSTAYTDTVFKENFSFTLPGGNYLLKVTIKNIPYSESKGVLYCDLLKKEDDTSLLKNPVLYNGTAGGFSVSEDTEVYLGMFINDLNVEKTSIFSLELYPAEVVSGKFVEKPSLMVRGRKKEIYNSSVSSINIIIPETAFYSGKEYPVEYIDSNAFNYEVTENGETVSQPLTKITTITVEGDKMIGFGNRAFKNCSSCTSFSCTSSAFQGGLFANNAAFERCEALKQLTLSIVKNINGLKESQTLKSIVMGGRSSYSFDQSFAGNTSIETIHWKNEDSFGAEKPFTANFGEGSFAGCTNLQTITSNDDNAGAILGEDTVFNVGSAAFAGCTSLIMAGTGFGSNTGPLYSSIGSQAFFGCTGLTSVDFGNREGAETIIGSQAFENCTGITSVNLPSTVTSIGSQAFKGCSSLETINIPFIGESATSTNNKFSYIFGTVPTSLTTVGFSKGNNITEIPDSAFKGCSNITSINGNDTENIVTIGAYGYAGTGITSIKISSTLVSIGSQAFSGCTGLTSVRFEKIDVNKYVYRVIGLSAFADCRNLTGVEVPGGFSTTENDPIPWLSLEALESWELNDFANETANPLYYAKNLKTQDVVNSPSCTSENYVKANYFGIFSPSSIKSFSYIGLTGIQLKTNVAQIGTKAFLGSSFEELHLRFRGIRDETGALISKAQILSNAFQDVTITKLVDLDTSMPILFYEDAFKNFNISTTNKYFEFVTGENYWGSLCYFSNPGANPIGQNGVTLAQPVLSVEGVAKVTTAYIDTSDQNWAISRLGIDPSKWGYQYCNNLNITSLSIASTQGKTAWTVPIAFCEGCSNLENFPTDSFNSNVSVVNDFGFYNCNKLSFAINSSKLSTIGIMSFENTGITYLTIEIKEDTTIGKNAFAGCEQLESVTITPPEDQSLLPKFTTGAGIFENCNNIVDISIPSFGAEEIPYKQRWQGSIFYLFNTNPSSYSLVPSQGAYSCVSGEKYKLYLPNSLKTFESTYERNYNQSYPIIGYTLYNNTDGSTPALLFQSGQGNTTVYNSASSYSEEAFKNNNGAITVK